MNYTTNTQVAVYPFTRQSEGEEIVIGRPDTSVFLVLPFDAVELLDHLSNGKTVGEAKFLYQQKYGKVPDLEELLEVLESKGFVQLLVKNRTNQSYVAINKNNSSLKFHFTNFPRSLAQKLFSYQVLVSCGVLIGLALVALVVEPSLVPGWNAHFFPQNLTLMRLLVLTMGYFTVFLHEMAHLVAARAVGVSSRLGIGHRLWVLVVETDMTGVWGIPRSQRYLPLLAGSLLDATSASILILLLFAESHGWLVFPAIIVQLSRAMLLTYLLRLLWQCYLFVRTDFYFVVANIFRCKNLIKDTEVFLRNQVAHVWHSIRQVDQSHIPPREMQAIACYAWLWVLGRVAAIAVLIFISLPLTWHYGLVIFSIFNAGFQAHPYAFIDALLLTWLSLITQGAGVLLFIRSLYKSLR
jgi:putative peptide zinc metalloprotease protein